IYGSVQQSSNANTRSVASLVLDSSHNVNFCLGSCSQTAKEWEPWLRLQLDRPYMVSSVGIVNRNDTQGLRLFGAEIRVGNSKANGGKGNALCAEDIFVPLGRSRDYPCPFLKGRFVSIIIPGRVDSLSLCEVKVNLNTY
uniref:Fucolectin tachylectin-4 pentraxin-1 domain-containing protein n=1 Tax=Petromyzon marinus TaxID=7757 RepID=S4RKK8_PETMA